MYPLKFQPVFQKRLWGGHALGRVLGRPIPSALAREPIGESWELADLPAGTVKADSIGAAPDGSLSSLVTNGPLAGRTLHHVLQNSDFSLHTSEFFPLLIKFLDARQDLSVQVHPDETYARNHPGAHLKSEAWYVIQAEPGARIYKGIKPGVTRDQFRVALETGEVEPLLNAIKVRAGDCHYLPSGTMHAMGAGILAAEVQTPSDTTFRVFDWNRLGADGQARTLHIKEALECAHFDAAAPAQPTAFADASGNRLVTCDHFTIDRRTSAQGAQQPIAGDMAIWIILEGQGVIAVDGYPPTPPTAFARGDTLLLPPSMKNPLLKTIANATWLEVKLPSPQAT